MTTRRLPDPIVPQSGSISAGDATYSFPTTDGPSGHILATNGAGGLAWRAPGTLTPKTVTGSYTALATDSFIRYTGTAAATVTLPQCSANVGLKLLILNSSDYTVTVAVHAGDTFDGDADPVLLDKRSASISLLGDGQVTWLIV